MIGTRILVFVLVIDIALFLGGFIPVPTFIQAWGFEIGTNDTYIGNFSSHGLFDTNTTVTATTPVSWLSPIFYVLDTVKWIFTDFLFAPLTTTMEIGAPLSIQLLFGAIWSILIFLAIISFIGGKDF